MTRERAATRALAFNPSSELNRYSHLCRSYIYQRDIKKIHTNRHYPERDHRPTRGKRRLSPRWTLSARICRRRDCTCLCTRQTQSQCHSFRPSFGILHARTKDLELRSGSSGDIGSGVLNVFHHQTCSDTPFIDGILTIRRAVEVMSV